jgi:hypothetical protein
VSAVQTTLPLRCAEDVMLLWHKSVYIASTNFPHGGSESVLE